MIESPDEVKVVLLGKQDGGKSCLLVRYLHRKFNPGKITVTIGAGYGTRTVNVNSGRVVLGIWDTAGSERYNAMSRVYYRYAVAALVCFDLTDATSFDRARFWVSELKIHEENCRIYLCGTKLDLVEDNPQERQVDSNIVTEYAHGINAKVFETSSKTGHNVEEVFYEVAKDAIAGRVNHEDTRTAIQYVSDTVILNREVEDTRQKRRFGCFTWRQTR